MSERRKEAFFGGSAIEKIKKLYKAPIKVNDEFKMPRIRIQDKDLDRNYPCTCCGKVYLKQEGNYIKAGNSIFWQGNNGYMPICKTCADTIFNALIEFYSGNEEHALRHWCGVFGYPYDIEASAMTSVATIHVGRSKVSLYPSKLNTKQVQSRCKSFLDTVRLEAGEASRIHSAQDIVETAEPQQTFAVTSEMLKKWGYGHKAQEYEWLEEQEKDWRASAPCKGKAQEELIRALCFAQLNIQKAQQGEGKVAEAMKAFQDLLAAYGLQPRQNTNDEFADQNTFGTLIKKFEEEEPIPSPDPEWEDVDGIKRYIDTWFLGHLCNNVHVTNDAEEMYRKEMEKYTVKPPSYENEDEAVDISLLEKFSNKGDGNNECDD